MIWGSWKKFLVEARKSVSLADGFTSEISREKFYRIRERQQPSTVLVYLINLPNTRWRRVKTMRYLCTPRVLTLHRACLWPIYAMYVETPTNLYFHWYSVHNPVTRIPLVCKSFHYLESVIYALIDFWSHIKHSLKRKNPS